MKRTVPLLITAIAGFVLIVAFFIPAAQGWGEDTAVWFDILASIAFLLGGGNLLKVHLKKVSDRQRGWGYSAITVLAFLVTLTVGLAKVGTRPALNTEYYGESFARVPLALLPEVRLPGTIPVRGDGNSLPASVRQQLRQDGGDIVFRGWMRPTQLSDLMGYHGTLAWQCLVERLHEVAQPPAPLRGRLSYHADSGSLGFLGFMTESDRDSLLEMFGSDESGTRAVAELTEAARREVSVVLRERPVGLQIPDSAAEYLIADDELLTIRGPMSPGLRDRLVEEWSNLPRVVPMSAAQGSALIAQLDELGTPLNDSQRRAVTSAMEGIWTPEQLQQVLDSAGEPLSVAPSLCEVLGQLQSGEPDSMEASLEGSVVTVNGQQQEAIDRFAVDETRSVDQLITELQSRGDFTERQSSALREFFATQPTVARWKRDLCLALMSAASASGTGLTSAQQKFLLEDFRDEYQWRETASRLFLKAHQVRYPWSGDYAEPGSPFWWTYAYLFQPLTATMFALLAFYVASAAFRAFRAKNTEAVLLLGAAFIILLGQTFAGVLLTAWLPDWLSALKVDNLSVYIMSLFNTAGNRAIMIGIALGIASTSLKVLLGVDRSYLGSGGE